MSRHRQASTQISACWRRPLYCTACRHDVAISLQCIVGILADPVALLRHRPTRRPDPTARRHRQLGESDCSAAPYANTTSRSRCKALSACWPMRLLRCTACQHHIAIPHHHVVGTLELPASCCTAAARPSVPPGQSGRSNGGAEDKSGTDQGWEDGWTAVGRRGRGRGAHTHHTKAPRNTKHTQEYMYMDTVVCTRKLYNDDTSITFDIMMEFLQMVI